MFGPGGIKTIGKTNIRVKLEKVVIVYCYNINKYI